MAGTLKDDINRQSPASSPVPQVFGQRLSVTCPGALDFTAFPLILVAAICGSEYDTRWKKVARLSSGIYRANPMPRIPTRDVISLRRGQGE